MSDDLREQINILIDHKLKAHEKEGIRLSAIAGALTLLIGMVIGSFLK